MSARAGDGDLPVLLVRQRAALARFVAREGRGLLRFETSDDLIQGICEHALRVAGRYEFRGEERFVAWLQEIARQHFADRNRYWSALKRGSARVLRLTWSGGERIPSSTATGPATVAARREQLALAARALALLSDRDRQLVQWLSEGVAVDEQAQRLGLSADSTRRASHRALERFRKTFQAIAGPS